MRNFLFRRHPSKVGSQVSERVLIPGTKWMTLAASIYGPNLMVSALLWLPVGRGGANASHKRPRVSSLWHLDFRAWFCEYLCWVSSVSRGEFGPCLGTLAE